MPRDKIKDYCVFNILAFTLELTQVSASNGGRGDSILYTRRLCSPPPPPALLVCAYTC